MFALLNINITAQEMTRYATPQEQTAGRIPKMMRDNPNLQAYVEIRGGEIPAYHRGEEVVTGDCVMCRHELDDYALRSIGDFTRENIATWLYKDVFEVGVYGGEDFHAVFGDINIPWTTEESRLIWERAHNQ